MSIVTPSTSPQRVCALHAYTCSDAEIPVLPQVNVVVPFFSLATHLHPFPGALLVYKLRALFEYSFN